MRSVTRPESCLSDLAFEELETGELGSDARAAIEAHLAGCTRCRDRRAELLAEHGALLAAAPDLASLAPARAHAPRARPRSQVIALGATVLALAAAALLVLEPRGPQATPDTRGKGAPHLGFFIKRGERVLPGESGAGVRAGDLVRFTYSSDRERYLALINLDARGAQVYFPADEGAAKRMRAGSEVALDFSVELDATEGDEQVFGLFCDRPLELAPVRAALLRDRALPELSGCAVDRVMLRKELAP